MSRTPQQLLRRVFPPMLATLADSPPPDERQWTYELKYDGFRAVIAFAGGEVAMWSRNELNLAPRFPQVFAALQKMKLSEAVLDGEVVAVDAEGSPRFQLLQQGDPSREKLFVFDLLWLDGHDLRNQTYLERRELLEKLLRRPPKGLALSEQLPGPGAEALKNVAAKGLEGVIAKRNDSVYEPRRSKAWLKLKAQNEQEFVIVGYNPSTASDREIGALHLAVMGDDGTLQYAGKVGTGFTAKLRAQLMDMLSRDVVPSPMVANPIRERVAVWVKPRYVAQVHFTEWTHDNRLRHPSFLGLRDDKSPKEVMREKPAAAQSVTVKLSHPERLLYPKDGYTKQGVADYYAAVSEPMIRALRDRPLSIEHWNQGIHSAPWFQQNIGNEAEPWMTTIETPTRTSKRSVRHLVADRPETLQWLAQMSVLTIHMWHSRGAALEEPDWIVFDLDPAKGKGIEQAIEAAILMRGLLEQLQLPSYPKTTGRRGIHVVVPLARGYSYEQAGAWACRLSEAVASQVPTVTVERSLSKRRGRLYLDCMQNAYGKTIVAPYSPRGVDGAPVSAPLQWSEVTKKLDPMKFTVKTMPKRLDKVGDLFAPALEKGAKLPELK